MDDESLFPPSRAEAERRIAEMVASKFGDDFAKAERGEHSPLYATKLQWRDHRTLQPRDFLYGHHLTRKLVSATVAPGGVGKSSLVMAETVAMITGRNLVGYKPRQKLRVWSWNGEDPFEELERRFFATCLQHGVSEADIGDRMFLDSGRNSPIVLATEDASGAKIATPVVDDLESEISMNGIDLVVIDPFISSHRVSENDNNKIEMVIKSLKGVAERCNCAFELVHHVRKARDKGETEAEDARGASALVDACRSVRALTRMSKERALEWGVEDVQRRSMFTVGSGKSNLGPGSSDRWYQNVGVDLGNATNELSSDNVGVTVEWEPPGLWSDIQPHALIKVQAAVTKRQWRASPQHADWVGVAVAEAIGLDGSDAGDRKRIKSMIAAWIASGALVEVKGLDEHRHEKMFVAVGKTYNPDGG